MEHTIGSGPISIVDVSHQRASNIQSVHAYIHGVLKGAERDGLAAKIEEAIIEAIRLYADAA